MFQRCLLAAAVLLAVPHAALAQIYKCTDRYGNPQYVQTKPRDAKCEESSVHAPPPNGGNVDNLMSLSKQIDKEHKQEARAEERADQQQQYRAALCSAARSRLAGLQSVGPVFSVDEKGERHYRTDAQKDQMMNDARAAIAANCS